MRFGESYDADQAVKRDLAEAIQTMPLLVSDEQKLEMLIDAKLDDWILRREAKKILKKAAIVTKSMDVLQWNVDPRDLWKDLEREKNFREKVLGRYPEATCLWRMKPEDAEGLVMAALKG